MEGLSALIKNAEVQDLIHRVSITRTAPKVPHLLFADDSIIFLQATLQECDAMKKNLRNYEKAS